jgi:hypothetical protein
MSKRIEIWEGPTFVTWNLEDYITAQTIDGLGNPLTPDDGRMFDDEIDQLRNMAVFESISVGQPEAGLTVRRIPDSP